MLPELMMSSPLCQKMFLKLVGTLSIDVDADDFPSLRSSHDTHTIPSAPEISDLPDYDIEEEMIQAAIEASKREAEISLPDDDMPQHRQSQSEDPEITHAVFLSLKSAEQEKAAFGELESEARPLETRVSKLVEDGETLASSNGKLVVGSSSIQDETEDADEQPLVRHRSRHMDPTRPQNTNNPVDAERVTSSLNGEESRLKNMMKRSCLRLVEFRKVLEIVYRIPEIITREMISIELVDPTLGLLLVRMPDGTCRCRGFLRTDMLQLWFLQSSMCTIKSTRVVQPFGQMFIAE